MDKQKLTKNTLDGIFAHFKINPQIDIKEAKDGEMQITVQGGDLSYLIGYRGQALEALTDMLMHILYKQTNEWPNLSLDINGYNQQRIDRLYNLAKRFIDRVRFFQTEVEMPALNAWERKQIHTYISEYSDVESESRGEGKNRKMYLKPKVHKK
jgi:spoIIIJ-associated protein